MPDIDPKLLASLGNLNLKTTPNINVNPTPQTGGPVPDQWSAMQNAVAALQAANSALQAANAALTGRVVELEKSMVAVRLVMLGVDPAFATVKQQVADLRTEYSTHTHTLPYAYESLTFLMETGDNNKPNFLIPYVWEGSDQSLTDFQRQKNAETVGRKVSAPKQNPV